MRKLFCLYCLLIASSFTHVLADDRPAVTAQEVATIADEYLKDRGLLDTTFVASITLEKASMFRPDRHWFVKWDAPLMVDGMKKEEIGLKVTMEGKVTRLVK